MSQDEIEARKERAQRGWLADPPPPPPRYFTAAERAALIAAGNRRYAHLANQRRDWVAYLRKNRPADRDCRGNSDAELSNVCHRRDRGNRHGGGGGAEWQGS